MDPLEFLARVLTHIPDKGQVTTRYYGWYATRPRGMRRHAEPVDPSTPVPLAPARPLAPPRPGVGGPSCSARSSRSTGWRARDAVGPCGSSR
ncbi:MAG: transposase [Gemmatimonadales bacterium]|nr:transposase [Gemmatimonadales bacterium]